MSNDRLKFRVWWKKENRYLRNPVLIFGKIGTETEIFEEGKLTQCVCTDETEIEQCTGEKDTNCNLIYDGDTGILTVFGGIGPNGGYVDSDEQVNVRVEWVKEMGGFYFVDKKNIYYDMSNNTGDFEICGNIHTQNDIEQKDGE